MEKNICIFGDSVTQASYMKQGWAELLKDYLENKYPDGSISVFNLGINGNTTGDILIRLESEAEARQATTIILAVGINDTKEVAAEQFRKNIIQLVEIAKEFTEEIFFVGLVLGDYQGEEEFRREKTAEFNQIIKEVAENNQCTYIQMQNVLEENDFMDGLHPNNLGHLKMFKEISKYF